uniref:Uncharacterized protein n=1 Tax=Picea sitchensis TaxID=3332 RepID=A9NW38_PICSI|nr:unknown [Picea sitchensis]
MSLTKKKKHKAPQVKTARSFRMQQNQENQGQTIVNPMEEHRH